MFEIEKEDLEYLNAGIIYSNIKKFWGKFRGEVKVQDGVSIEFGPINGFMDIAKIRWWFYNLINYFLLYKHKYILLKLSQDFDIKIFWSYSSYIISLLFKF